MRTATMKINIALPDGKKQEFTFKATVLNDDINLPDILWKIERAINDAPLPIRAHVDINTEVNND